MNDIACLLNVANTTITLNRTIAPLILLVWTLLSCNHRVSNKFAGAYQLNGNTTCHFDNLELVLERNGTYYFRPETESLIQFEGQWEAEYRGIDGDIPFFTFKLNNGEIQSSNYLIIKINSGEPCSLNFDDRAVDL